MAARKSKVAAAPVVPVVPVEIPPVSKVQVFYYARPLTSYRLGKKVLLVTQIRVVLHSDHPDVAVIQTRTVSRDKAEEPGGWVIPSRLPERLSLPAARQNIRDALCRGFRKVVVGSQGGQPHA